MNTNITIYNINSVGKRDEETRWKERNRRSSWSNQIHSQVLLLLFSLLSAIIVITNENEGLILIQEND